MGRVFPLHAKGREPVPGGPEYGDRRGYPVGGPVNPGRGVVRCVVVDPAGFGVKALFLDGDIMVFAEISANKQGVAQLQADGGGLPGVLAIQEYGSTRWGAGYQYIGAAMEEGARWQNRG